MIPKFILQMGLIGLLLVVLSCKEEAPQGVKQEAGQAAGKDSNAQAAKQVILFFGNSLTAAYGLDPAKGFVGLIQQRIDSLGLPFRTVNAGLSGETTAGGNSRIEWILEQQRIDVFVLELGGNDGLRGIQPESSYQNLQSIIDKVRAKFPKVRIILAGMEAPPNMGKTFTTAFRNNYPRLAKANKIELIPFLLEGVAGEPTLNQADGIHPNEAGSFIVRETVWRVLFK